MTSSSSWSGDDATDTPTDTETPGHAQLPQVERRDGAPDALPHLDRDLGAGVLEQHGELLAAEARRDVVLADRARDRLGDLTKDVVADGMPERVVELLEPVDVDHEHAHAVLGAASLGEQPDVLVEVAAVREPGEGIGRRPGLGLAQRVDAGEGRGRLDGGGLEDPAGGRRPRDAGPRVDRTIAPSIRPLTRSGAATTLDSP